MSEFLLVLTTTDSAALAQTIATALVEQQLAACVQVVGPIQSTYRWQDTVQTDTEWQCQIKTTRDRFADVEAAIQVLHTYDLPEVIALPIPLTAVAYGDWWHATLASRA